MSKYEKHVHAGRQGQESKPQTAEHDPLDDLEGSEEVLKSSFTAGKEMKLAVGVIVVLLVIFGAAMVKWMRRSSSPAPTPAEETALKSSEKMPVADEKPVTESRDRSPFGMASRSSEPVTATAASAPIGDSRSKSRSSDSDSWSFASGGRGRPSRSADDRQSSTPSFRPRIPLGDSDGRSGGTTARGAGGASPGAWENAPATTPQASGNAAADPFRGRTTADGPRNNTPAMGASSLRSSSTPAGANPLRMPDFSGAVRNAAPASPNRLTGAVADAPPASRPATDSRPFAASVPPAPGASRAYVVQQGDNIYEVARRELGKASRWREIYDLNKAVLGTQSLDLTPGTQLVLPDAGPAVMSQRNESGRRR